MHNEQDDEHAHLPIARADTLLVTFPEQSTPGSFNPELSKHGADLSVPLSEDVRAAHLNQHSNEEDAQAMQAMQARESVVLMRLSFAAPY